jgi:CRISPR-associated protein Csb2
MVAEDLVAECGRRGLPRPEIELLGLTAGPNGGDIAADVRLRFSVVVQGPILLGRDSHFGGGLFWAKFPAAKC